MSFNFLDLVWITSKAKECLEESSELKDEAEKLLVSGRIRSGNRESILALSDLKKAEAGIYLSLQDVTKIYEK